MKQKIAIIGLSGLLPGSETPQQFWQNLIAGKDLTSDATVEEFGVNPDYFYNPAKGNLDKCYSLKGGFIRDFTFSPEGYQIKPEFLERLDDLFKFSLYASRHWLHGGLPWLACSSQSSSQNTSTEAWATTCSTLRWLDTWSC